MCWWQAGQKGVCSALSEGKRTCGAWGLPSFGRMCDRLRATIRKRHSTRTPMQHSHTQPTRPACPHAHRCTRKHTHCCTHHPQLHRQTAGVSRSNSVRQQRSVREWCQCMRVRANPRQVCQQAGHPAEQVKDSMQSHRSRAGWRMSLAGSRHIARARGWHTQGMPPTLPLD